MDRKKFWPRTEQTYNLLTRGQGIAQESGATALRHAYNRGESDEYLSPTVITDAHHKPLATVGDGDAVIFFNLRSDRARQLAKPFVQARFEHENPGSFKRWKQLKNLCFVALTDFGPDLGNILTAYPSRDIQHTLPMALAGLKQIYLAESEKFAHMTYFFNGGYDHSVAGEHRLMVPSPNVVSYDRAPAMAATALTTAAESAIRRGRFEFVGMNFANLDMVGHTGNFVACVKALEVVDACLKRLGRLTAARSGTLLITADHGNIEETINQKTGEIDTEHSVNPVPCLLYRAEYRGRNFARRRGILADVAPTVLDLLGLPKPKEMVRPSLFHKL
jgi:2,3-bisphosphoglycerate-independent phosphoglycerate mutase